MPPPPIKSSKLYEKSPRLKIISLFPETSNIMSRPSYDFISKSLLMPEVIKSFTEFPDIYCNIYCTREFKELKDVSK